MLVSVSPKRPSFSLIMGEANKCVSARCVIIFVGVVESSGIHLLEVDNSNSEGWNLLEIMVIVLALKLGLVISHTLHYCCVTKKLVKKKLNRAVEMEIMKNADQNPAVAYVAGELQIPALP